MHLVLDHSVLIPCGDKPEEEKQAIRMLGDTLPGLDAVWHVSRRYLKTVQTVCMRAWRGHHPLPRLQAALLRTLSNLLALANTRKRICRAARLSREPGTKLYIYVVARNAYRTLEGKEKELLEELAESHKLTKEDIEVLAITLKASRSSEIIIASTDTRLLDAATRVARQGDNRIRPLLPTELVKLIEAGIQ